jgi:hypothetical protein
MEEVIDTVSATAVPSVTSAASATIVARARLVHGEGPSVDVPSVELLDRSTSLVIGHLDETEPARPAGVAIGYDGRRLDGSVLTEQ